MTAPTKTPPTPRPGLTITAQLPTMRVACTICRHTSPTLTGSGRVDVVLACKCLAPDVVLILGFPGQDLPVPLEPVGQ